MTNFSSSDMSALIGDEEFAELLWENGQVVIQGSNRDKKNDSSSNNFGSHFNRVAQEKNSIEANFPKIGRIETIGPYPDEFCVTESPKNLGPNNQDVDMVPWMSYPVEDSLATDYWLEFLSDISGANLNTLTGQSSTQPSDKGTSFSLPLRASRDVEPKSNSRTNLEEPDPSRARNFQVNGLSDERQISVPNTKSRAGDTEGRSNRDSNRGAFGDLPGARSQKQELESSKPLQSSCSNGLMNFSHFSKLVAMAKANMQSIDRVKGSGNASTISSIDSTGIQSRNGVPDVSGIQRQLNLAPNKPNRRSPSKNPKELTWVEPLCTVGEKDKSRKLANNVAQSDCSTNHVSFQNSDVGTGLALGRREKAHESIIASSSVCSANSLPATSDDGKQREKRKAYEIEESGDHSDELEFESVDFKKHASLKEKSAKRSRAAEVHNMSERRRRDRINEKMRALQELIPNCNKVDKASMLEEAIEYLKSLQLHVQSLTQMMSMGSGLCIPPMMLPAGMQQMRIPPMPHFPQMGLGMQMGMRFGYGMGMLETLVPVPPMPGQPYGLQGILGSPGLSVFGNAGQGFSTDGLARNVNSFPDVAAVAANSLRVPDAAPSKSKENENLNMEMISNNNPQGNKEPLEQVGKQALHENGKKTVS